MHASKGRKYYACTAKRSQKRREIMVTISRRDLCRLALLSLMVAFDGRSYKPPPRVCSKEGGEAVPRTPWLGYGIQPVSGLLTPCTEGKTGLRSTNPMYGRRPLTPGASPAGACSVP